MKTRLLSIVLLSSVIFSCKKNDSTPPAASSTNGNTNTPTAAKSFSDVTFGDNAAYFALDGSMNAPVDSNSAKSISSKIDLTFFFDYNYIQPGFMDPVTRSQTWYWNDFHEAWLSNAHALKLYTTNLTASQFNAATSDQSKIATYFADTAHTKLAPHAIFPYGTCIGGRQTANPNSALLTEGAVFGFILSDGKKGLLYIRTDQTAGWPYPLNNDNCKVDIIREN